MLTWVDCLSLSELTADEIRAVAAHEHRSDMAALEMGSWLVVQPDRCRVLKRMILDELERAVARKDPVGAARLKLVMRHFCSTHPENPEKQPAA